jgi:hypothetical protein
VEEKCILKGVICLSQLHPNNLSLERNRVGSFKSKPAYKVRFLEEF